MKVMDKEQIMKANMERPVMAEKGILQNVRHPFVIQLHSAFQVCIGLSVMVGQRHSLEKRPQVAGEEKFANSLGCHRLAEK